MKEQMSIKDKIVHIKNPVIAPEDYILACMDCANHLIMDQRLLVKRDEYERLKRLGDNVKNKLEEARKLQAAYKVSMEECKPEYCDCNSICTQEKLYTYFKSVAELLESLDK